MKIFDKLKGFFVKSQSQTPKNVKRESSVVHRNGKRFLNFKDSDCALILHDDNQVEVVFTKYYNENQDITPSEELLMAIAMYLKQPGFGEMLVSEFHKIAMKNSSIFEESANKNKKDKEE